MYNPSHMLPLPGLVNHTLALVQGYMAIGHWSRLCGDRYDGKSD